ncbi:acyltransferase [Bacillus sp. REN3]|uniref:acyltransferase n=1 Tax=Bacillus sp. REN3 TaxID=2802440 RepID=UPI001AED3C32|nr:acyltransferase [Bacillus sp. REN3]
MSAKRRYIYEIHYIRAIASLMVLLVHVSASYFYQQGQQYNDFTFFINQISRFGTPMFAMISGFLLFYQTRERGFDLKKFFSSRFTKIGIPFFVWSVFYLLFMYYAENVNPLENGRKLFVVNFLSGNAFYHLYFISIVFQFYLIFSILQVFRSRRHWPVLLGIAALVNLYFLKTALPADLDGLLAEFLNQRAFLPKWIYFFIFGGFLAYYWEPLLAFSKRYKIALSGAALVLTVLAVLEYKQVGSIPSNRPTNLINIPVLVLFLAGIMEDIRKTEWLSKFLKTIGTLSMAIYLVHPFVIYVFQKTAPAFFWKTSLFPVTYGIILALTIVLVKAIRLLPYSNYILTVPKVKTSNEPIPTRNITSQTMGGSRGKQGDGSRASFPDNK